MTFEFKNRDEICTRLKYGDDYDSRARVIRENLLERGWPECDIVTDDDYSEPDNWASLRQQAIEACSVPGETYADVLADVVNGVFGDGALKTPHDEDLRRLVANATPDQMCWASVMVLKPELLK